MQSRRIWKVGEIAKKTGLTVRTLHHWDAIGLLVPSTRSDAGYRLYDEADVRRLQQIVSLRSVGLSLEEIRDCLSDSRFTLPRIIRTQIERIDARIDAERSLRARLEGIERHLRSRRKVSVDDLFETIEAIETFERHFTPEERREIEARARAIGGKAVREAEEEWPKLVASVRSEMDRGTDPKNPRVRALARRWNELVEAFTGGNPEIARSLASMYRQEPAARERSGLDLEVLDYIRKSGS